MGLDPEEYRIAMARREGVKAPPVRSAAPTRKEREIQTAIFDYLKLIPGLWERNNRRVVTMPGAGGRPRPVTFGGLPGAADIRGIIPPHGRAVAIEVKRDGAYPTREQFAYLARVRELGGIAIVARSVEDVRRALQPPPSAPR